MARRKAAEAETTETVALTSESPAPADAQVNGHEPQAEASDGKQSWAQRATIIADLQAGAKFHFNYEKHKAAVTFDEKPSPEVRTMLKDGGYRWNGEEEAWEIPINFATRAQDRTHAKKIFYQVRDAIRQEKGIEPASQPIPD